ncbi:MAG: Rrf2 family transcriptional regulator [Candidatus Zixiibacteriota bacterium]
MITKKTEYAIRALWELAHNPEHLATANQIAQRQGIPPKYLPQIISELSRSGLILSVRGYGGGVRLSRPAKEITLLDVIEAMQGKLTMFECQLGEYECINLPHCGLQETYTKAQSALEHVFGETKLSDVRFKQHTKGRDA